MATAHVSSFNNVNTDAPYFRSLAQLQREIMQNKRNKNKNGGRNFVIGMNRSKDLDIFASRRCLLLSTMSLTKIYGISSVKILKLITMTFILFQAD